MKKEILMSLEVNERRVAILEDGKLEEFFIERSDAFKMFGNIYKGKVKSIVPGIGAAFIDLGTKKDGFLYVADAVELCKLIGMGYSIIHINRFLEGFEDLEWGQSKIANMNSTSRIRGVLLYNYANTHNALVIGTSNKTEILLGYFTKYGDGAVDIEAIGELLKTDERELARFIGVPEKIIKKVPTAELYHGQTDEGELGISYDELDKLLRLYIEKKSDEDIAGLGFDRKTVDKAFERIKANEHKRNMPPTIKIS